jgi:16S rRNA (guanine(966)-N(2))-methyltransferase RsmD
VVPKDFVLRVIAGKFRSRPLRSLKGQALRPTSDRLRETLFNILRPSLEAAIFIDLYAGTGAVGIEALSRGARSAIFVEKHGPAASLIRRNLESLAIGGEAEILGMAFAVCRDWKPATRTPSLYFSIRRMRLPVNTNVCLNTWANPL